MPHRRGHNIRNRRSSANRMVRAKGSRLRNETRNDPTPSNGLFGLPATFTIDTNVINDVQVGGGHGPDGNSGLLTGHCLSSDPNSGNYDEAYPEGGCFTGHFKINGIDIDEETGDMEVWPDEELLEDILAWFSWTIDTDPNGQLLCDPNEECLNPYYSSIGTWVTFGIPSCGNGQCVGPFFTWMFDEDNDIEGGTNNGIYYSQVEPCQSDDTAFCPVEGGTFTLENCQDFSGNPDDPCQDDGGEWYFKKNWEGTISSMAGGSSTQYLITLLANGKARFGKGNPNTGTIVTDGAQLVSAGASSAVWSLVGDQFTLTRWHPNQICTEDPCEGYVYEDQLWHDPAGTQFTATLQAGDNTVDFLDGNIVDWNNNNGSFEISTQNNFYPPQPLELGGFDIQDGQNMSITRYMLGQPGGRPESIDYTLYQDGTYTRTGGNPGTWQVKPQQGIIELTSTYSSNWDVPYDTYTTNANSLAEGLDVSLGGGSMYDYGIQAGEFLRRDGALGYWYSLPMDYGHSGYHSQIFYGISNISGGSMMSFFPTNPGDTHKVWQCNYHSYFQSFACFEERSDNTAGAWNIIAGNIDEDGNIYGPAYVDNAWVRGYWEASNLEGSIDGTHGFSGTATWTHQYSNMTFFDDTYNPWEQEYYLIPPDQAGYEPVTWDQNSPIGGDVIPGDVNFDGIVNVQDVVEILNVILHGDWQNESQQWIDAADVTGNNVVNISDIVVIVQSILNNRSLSAGESKNLRRLLSCIQTNSNFQHCASMITGNRNVRSARMPSMGRRARNRRNVSRKMSSIRSQAMGRRPVNTRISQRRNNTGKISNARGGKNPDGSI